MCEEMCVCVCVGGGVMLVSALIYSVCLSTSTRMLSFTAPQGQTALVFAAVFVVVWVGAAVVTLNAQLLGGTM